MPDTYQDDRLSNDLRDECIERGGGHLNCDWKDVTAHHRSMHTRQMRCNTCGIFRTVPSIYPLKHQVREDVNRDIWKR